MRYSRLSSVSIAALLSASVATPALAQLDEIIVTATKRAQSLQEVPIAVTAFDTEELEAAGISNIKDLRIVTPSLQITQSNSSTDGINFRIRGVGTTGNNPALEGAVGVYMDGVYLSRQGIAFREFLDLEQIEVLRGPQGTIFGRNTTAGALNIKTKAPSLTDVEAQAAVTYGDYETTRVALSGNVPLIQDQLGLRVSAAYNYQDSFYEDDLGYGGDAGIGLDNYAVRGQLGFEATDSLSFRLIADFSDSDDTCCAGGWGSMPDTVQAALVAVTGSPVRVEENAGLIQDRVNGINRPNNNPSDEWGVSLQVDWENQLGTLTYIGSYRDWFGSQDNADFDFTHADLSYGTVPVDFQTQTHEIRLQGRNGNVDWMIGGFWSDEQLERQFAAGAGTDFEAYQDFFIQAFTLNPALTMDSLISALTLGAITDYDGDYYTAQDYETDGNSWSIFTHNIIDVTPKLDLTVGARWIREDKDGSMRHAFRNDSAEEDPIALAAFNDLAVLGGAPGATILDTLPGSNAGIFGAAVLLAAGNCSPVLCNIAGISPEYDAEFSDEELTGVVSLGYDWTDNLRTYASFSHGFKAGGILLDGSAAAGGASPVYDSEEVDSYEIGIRSDWFDGLLRANITGFYMDYTNLQVQEFTGTQFVVFNVPDAQSVGVEAEFFSNPMEGLDVNLSVTYADASYEESSANLAQPAPIPIISGRQMTVAPLWSGSLSGTYTRTLPNTSLSTFVRADWYLESNTRTGTAPGSNLTTQEPFKRQAGFGKVNARIGIGDVDGKWGLELWGQNLLNKTTRTLSFNGTTTSFTPFDSGGTNFGSVGYGQADPPRTWGVTLRAVY